MLHLIIGQLEHFDQDIYISNQSLGVQVTYLGDRKEGRYFLFPLLDDHAKTIRYYAFDDAIQKSSFVSTLKISGIGPKIAYEIAWTDQNKLLQAIQTFDLAFFQTIPGIGPKTAKKVLVELKSSFSNQDIIKINADTKLVNNIVKTLTTMGYEKNKILTTLALYEGEITQEYLSQVIEWLLQKLG